MNRNTFYRISTCALVLLTTSVAVIAAFENPNVKTVENEFRAHFNKIIPKNEELKMFFESTKVSDNITIPHQSKNGYRLPEDIVPIHYDIYLNPNLKTQLYEGFVTIELKIIKTTNKIVLHVKDLATPHIYIIENNIKKEVKHVNLDYKKEFLVIQTNEDLVKGQKYFLEINFSGDLKNKIVGFYSSSYLANGKPRLEYANTQVKFGHSTINFVLASSNLYKEHFSDALIEDWGNSTSPSLQ